MSSLAADNQHGRHLTLGEMNPIPRDKSKRWTLHTTRKRLKLSGQSKPLKRVVEEGEFKDMWYQAKEQNLLVCMLPGNYCPRNCICSREGRKEN